MLDLKTLVKQHLQSPSPKQMDPKPELESSDPIKLF